MNGNRRSVVVFLLVLSLLGSQAHNSFGQVQAKHASNKARSEEQILLEQLSEKLQVLDRMSDKVDGLEQEIRKLQEQLQQANQTAEAARADAAKARKELESAQQAVWQNDQQVEKLQSAVSDLSGTSTAIAVTIQENQRAITHPETIHFKGIELKPGGFVAAETVDRQRGVSGDVNTPFSSIPFGGTTAGVLSEFNASGRQSRLSLLAEGKLSKSRVSGYFETDFLSAGTTSNNNQSNSYTLRIRQAWAQAALNSGWTFTGGQMWSLATEYRHGLENNTEATPLTIDAQYNVGFTWARQYGFRITKNIGPRLWIGGAVEEAQTLNIGGHNLPTIAYQQSGSSGGLYNPTANYSFNYAPDLVAKIAWEPGFGHYELFGIGRFFRDRVFPNGQASTASALGAFTAKTAGGGAGANARIPLFAKRVDFGAHILVGNGIGRYSTSALPDATAHPDGSLELLVGGSALGSLEYHATRRFDLYGYYGGEYAKRAYYPNGLYVTTAGSTYGQPILAGYGAPNNVVSGCYTETLPSSGLASGASSTTCQADNRNIQEGTFGYWFRFYKGSRGTFQQGFQYSYTERHTWQGIGANGLGFSPKAIDNMWFTSFRYYLPQ